MTMEESAEMKSVNEGNLGAKIRHQIEGHSVPRPDHLLSVFGRRSDQASQEASIKETTSITELAF